MSATSVENVGEANLRVGWIVVTVGMVLGALIGLWSFGGPIAPPPEFGDYADRTRRLVRLAHIAAIALPVLNFHYVSAIRRVVLPSVVRRRSCALMLVGMVTLPALLICAAFVPPALYLLPLPVTALIVATAVLAHALILPAQGG